MQQVQAHVNFRQDIVFYIRVINWRSNMLEFPIPNDYTWSHTITRPAVCSRTYVFSQGKRFNMCVIDVHMWYSVSYVHMWNHLIRGLNMWSCDYVFKIIIHMWFDINSTWSTVEITHIQITHLRVSDACMSNQWFTVNDALSHVVLCSFRVIFAIQMW